MKLLNTYTLEIKKSKFIGYLYEVKSKEEVKSILEELKKEHKKARHIPYAFILNSTAGKSDDKEPSGTAGSPIYQVLDRLQEKNRALFIVRYFGGTKLGAGGLLRAYAKSAQEVVNLKGKNQENTC